MVRFTYRVIKRLFDFLCSFLGMIITLPLWLAFAIGIKLSSKGPVFFTTNRVGKGGKPFKVYKFRSMHQIDTNADKMNEGTYIANPNRIFKLGAFLRKSKLDELPQLLNILLGQMSVVGPRPVPATTAAKNYSGSFACVLDVRPGLACLDSLYDYAHGELFVSDIEEYRQRIVPVRNMLARMYVQKQSIALDLHCIFRTVQLIFQIAVLKKREFPYTKYETEAQQAVFGAVAVGE